MHIFSTLSTTTTTRTSISLFLHFQSAEYIGERVREIAQPFLFVYIHLYVVFSRRFLSSNSVCVRYRKQKWEKTNPTECLSPCRGRGAYGGGGYHIFPFSEEQLWISSPLTKNKQTLIQAERTGALAAPARPRTRWRPLCRQSLFRGSVLTDKCNGTVKGCSISVRPSVCLSVPQAREETTSSSIYHDSGLFFQEKTHTYIYILVIMSYKLCYDLNEK